MKELRRISYLLVFGSDDCGVRQGTTLQPPLKWLDGEVHGATTLAGIAGVHQTVNPAQSGSDVASGPCGRTQPTLARFRVWAGHDQHRHEIGNGHSGRRNEIDSGARTEQYRKGARGCLGVRLGPFQLNAHGCNATAGSATNGLRIHQMWTGSGRIQAGSTGVGPGSTRFGLGSTNVGLASAKSGRVLANSELSSGQIGNLSRKSGVVPSKSRSGSPNVGWVRPELGYFYRQRLDRCRPSL